MQEFQEYPKWVAVPGTESGGVVVYSREEEDGLQESAVPAETAAKVTRKRKVAE